ncbi:MAG: hypothetical protein JO042_04745 [Sinobacteraceae bacterium]|nr:hypothetical protein [Nevskiaceae bacterium]
MMTTSEELVERAKGLVPRLRGRAHNAEEMGRLHDETVQELVEAELLKTMTPKRFGGLQFSWDTGARIIETIASGDSSAGWVMNAYLSTSWVMSIFPLETQQEVFGSRGYALGPCPINPGLGKARKVAGGYRVTLKGPFASGVYHSEWAVACAMVEKGDNSDLPVSIVMLLPRADYTFDLSSWAVLGMKATGSATIIAEDVFVPDQRAMGMEFLSNGKAPGAVAHKSPVYRVPYGPGFFFYTTAALLGMARHGVDAFRDHLLSAIIAFTGEPKSDNPAAQMSLGSAAAPVDAAAALIHSDVAACLSAVEKGTLDISQRSAFRLHGAYAALLCRQSITAVKDMAGANALRQGSPIQRVFRDIQMASGNWAFNLPVGEELYGRHHLGKPINTEFV